MRYFINVFDESYGQAGRFYTYRLYSGKSERELKKSIIEGIKDGWDFIDAISELDSSKYLDSSLSDIADIINDIINDYIQEDYGDVTNYRLGISRPYTKIDNAFSFYINYREVSESDLEGHEEANFYFYGDYGIDIQDIFPYLSDLKRDYHLRIDEFTIDRMMSILK
jgi:hypothetical protein